MTRNCLIGKARGCGCFYQASARSCKQYKLKAVTSGFTLESEPFDITPAKSPWTRQPKVAVKDDFGNMMSSSAKITVAFGNNPSSGMLSGKTEVSAVGGIASFTDLSTDKVGMGYTLKASSPDKVFAIGPIVEIRDGYGNPVITGPDAGASLSIALASGEGKLSGEIPRSWPP